MTVSSMYPELSYYIDNRPVTTIKRDALITVLRSTDIPTIPVCGFLEIIKSLNLVLWVGCL